MVNNNEAVVVVVFKRDGWRVVVNPTNFPFVHPAKVGKVGLRVVLGLARFYREKLVVDPKGVVDGSIVVPT